MLRQECWFTAAHTIAAPGGRPAHPAVAVYARLASVVEGFSTAPSPADAEGLAALLTQIIDGGAGYRSHAGAVRLAEGAVVAAVACAPQLPALVKCATSALRALCTAHEANRAAVSAVTAETLLSLVSPGQPSDVAR